MRSLRKRPLLFATLALIWAALMVGAPLDAQQPSFPAPVPDPGDLSRFWTNPHPAANDPAVRGLPDPLFLHQYSFGRPAANSLSLERPLQFGSAGIIGRMEAAFYCNDTPFIDQVRLPMAAFWGGRVKLIGFESDVTTANFVLGLPGAGLLTSLSMTGSGHLATRTPPSDQLVGVHMTLNLHGGEVEAFDNSGLRGMQYLVRASRSFFQSFTSR